MVVNEQPTAQQGSNEEQPSTEQTTEQTTLPVELQELPIGTTLKEKRYTVQEYQTKVLDVWIYVIEDKDEKYKRYKKCIEELKIDVR